MRCTHDEQVRDTCGMNVNEALRQLKPGRYVAKNDVLRCAAVVVDCDDCLQPIAAQLLLFAVLTQMEYCSDVL